MTTDLTRSMLDNNFVNGPNPKRMASQSVLAVQYKNSRFTATASLLGTYITDKVEQGEKPDDKRRLSPAVKFVLAAILGKYFADTCLLQRYIPGSYIYGLVLPPYGKYKFETGRNFPI